MAVQPADVLTARALTNLQLDYGRTPRGLSQKQIRRFALAATRNAETFGKKLPRSRDAQARAVKESLLLGATRAAQFASRRLVQCCTNSSSNTNCILTSTNDFNCGVISMSASSSHA